MYSHGSAVPNSQRFCKQALDPTEAQQRLAALRAVLGLTAAGGLVGAGARGLRALQNEIWPAKPPTAEPLPQHVLRVPVVRQADQDAADRKRLGLSPDTDLRQAAVAPLEKLSRALAKQAGLADLLPPTSGASNPAMNALYMPGTILGPAVAAAGGWTLVDKILANRQAAKRDAELSAARNDYRRAIAEQYAAMLPAKAAATEFQQDLGQVAKCAGWSFTQLAKDPLGTVQQGTQAATQAVDTVRQIPQWFTNRANELGGGYLTALAALTAGAGVGTYQWANARSQTRALEEALRQRRLERAKRPPAVVALAEPTAPEV